MPHAHDHLRSIRNFNELIQYLEDELGWPLNEYGFDDLTFQYDAEELGLKDDDAAKVKAIYQLRPLQHGQPWGIFFVEFEKKKLPVVVLRRILSHLVVKKRASANRANEAAWHAEDLLFVTAFGDDGTEQREIAFAHFHVSPGDLPTLRVLGWDGNDTPLKLSHVDKELHELLHWPDDPSDHKAWRDQWRKPFKHRIGHIISTADALAEAMASLARGIRDKAKKMLDAESENGPLRKLHKAFQTALIHDLKEDDFADTYAQTITYGLLTAVISRTEGSEGRHGTFIIAEDVTDMVPITNPFLREMLQTFLKVGGRKGGIDFDELGIQDVVDLLRGDETDLPAILRDFGNKTKGEDPVIHFYEHFLAAYNKKLKVQRGVFYTPKPVVSYIVRSVHELLQTEFGLEDGLASTVTWGEMAQKYPPRPLGEGRGEGGVKIPAGVSPDSPFVMVLDPATGTATFLVEVIDVIHKVMTAKWQKQGKREAENVTLWNDYVPKHLLPRIYGYELMMAPYAIAHMKIGLKLFETGYQFMSDARVRVYLTNALEPASDEQQKLVGIVPALAHEAEAVNAVKRSIRFTLVVGNPPYSGHSTNNGIWISDLLRRKLPDSADSYFKVDGQDLGERNPKWLNDDYVKFIRYGQNQIAETGPGILAFITNHGFLDNPTFRGMRQSLMTSFSDIYLLNLHGNTKKGEVADDGAKDENVFDIQQGVSVGVFLSVPIKYTSPHVYYLALLGKRQNKYQTLHDNQIQSVSSYQLKPDKPYYLFSPQNVELRVEYLKGTPVSEIFPVNSVGIVTARDHLTIQWTKNGVFETIREFSRLNEAEARNNFDLGPDARDWKVTLAQKDIQNSGIDKDNIKPIHYRVFDTRFTYYTGQTRGFICMPRPEVMGHMLISQNIGIVSARQQSQHDVQWSLIGISDKIIEGCVISNKTKEINYLFPLYIFPKIFKQQTLSNVHAWPIDDNGQVPNLSPDFVRTIEANTFLDFDSAGIDNTNKFTPKCILDYIYALLHCPTYRTRYGEFLKIDFPRILLTSSPKLFRSLAKLGSELIALHLLESPTVNNFITTFTGKGDNSIPKKPTWKDNAVWINPSQRFEGVPENVWNFHIGGYQVCEKWLKDRKGRTLSDEDITHYQRIIVSLSETIRIMAEIDQVIDEHGGWPIK